jgi:hypothetical protein
VHQDSCIVALERPIASFVANRAVMSGKTLLPLVFGDGAPRRVVWRRWRRQNEQRDGLGAATQMSHHLFGNHGDPCAKFCGNTRSTAGEQRAHHVAIVAGPILSASRNMRAGEHSA